MKRFYPLVLALALMSIPLVAQGRLGETVAECETRYGKPNGNYTDGDLPGLKNALFEKDGMIITIGFLNGKAVRVSYSKSSAGPAPLPQEVIDKLLEDNRGGSSWAIGHGGDGFSVWNRADGAVCNYVKPAGLLNFEDATFVAGMKQFRDGGKPK